VLAAAVLSLSVGASAYAAGLPVKEPAQQASTAQQGSERIIVKYRTGTAAATDRSAKLAAVTSAVSRASLGTTTAARNAAASPQHLRRLGTGADVIRLQGKLSQAELQKVLTEIQADPSVQYAEADVKLQRADVRPQAKPRSWCRTTRCTRSTSMTSSAMPRPRAPHRCPRTNGALTITATGLRPTTSATAGIRWPPGQLLARHPRGRHHRRGDQQQPRRRRRTAYNAKVLPVRVLGKCGGYTSDIADAITWASGGTVSGVPANANPAEVINMSLGGGGSCCDAPTRTRSTARSRAAPPWWWRPATRPAMRLNFRPASCANVVAVGATRITGGIAYYSNFGAAVDLSGPGGGGSVDGNPGGYVWQAGYNGLTTPTSGAYSYMGMGGTSMASPHVAGVAALVQGALASAGKDPLTPAQLEALLKQTARTFPVTIPAATPIGSGIVDAKAALAKALEEPCTVDCAPDATPLTNRVAVGGLSGAGGNEVLYSFEATAGKTLSFLTYGGSGNVSLYVKRGQPSRPRRTSVPSPRVRATANRALHRTGGGHLLHQAGG
jgi:serine protease